MGHSGALLAANIAPTVQTGHDLGPDLADAVSTGTERCEAGVADGTLQGTAPAASIGLQVANFCCYGALAARVWAETGF